MVADGFDTDTSRGCDVGACLMDLLDTSEGNPSVKASVKLWSSNNGGVPTATVSGCLLPLVSGLLVSIVLMPVDDS